MARLMLIGAVAEVEFTTEPTEGGVIATCVKHPRPDGWTCTWSETYDDMNDATEYAADHADEGRS